ncbi:MAG: thiamine-phosphate kinase [Candidatus Polarisedimenticolia bacterium]
MTRARLSEESFLQLVRRRFGRLSPPSPQGIGDDAAVMRPPRGAGRLLAAADGLIESVHFRRGEPPFFLGRKALAVNLSDVAAMGCRPVSFLLTLAVPADLPLAWLDTFLEGLASGTREHGVTLAGGDTCASPGPIMISIAILGESGPSRRPVLTRHGARPGDLLYVSGALGGSAAGRALLERGWKARLGRGGRTLAGAAPRGRAGLTHRSRAAQALRSHLDPRPRIDLGRRLRERGIASAAMDISDGLALDLWRLTRASKVGARLVLPALPIADSARTLGPVTGTDPVDLALHGGEDYELLFAVPPGRSGLLRGLDALFVGHVVSRSAGLTLVDAAGSARPLRPKGFDHFRRSRP